jgi:hypothetical protein
LADPAGPALTLRFVAGPDVDALDLPRSEILAAVEGAVRAQGEGRVVLEPRVHLAPPNGGAGHFNVLRGHLGPEHVSGVKVVGDFVGNWRLGLPSELALVLLLDPDTGMPLGIVDGTMLTAARTGALTALGARHLARPDARVLGHLGARGSAWWNVTMLDDLFDFEEIRVTSRPRAGHHRPGRGPPAPPAGRRGRPRHPAALPLTWTFRLATFAPSVTWWQTFRSSPRRPGSARQRIGESHELQGTRGAGRPNPLRLRQGRPEELPVGPGLWTVR